ncbi:uncharacterized protein [Chironomus tepperi]|uniref:uncharacterized protein n=1 Tax=Chironomus tepperi TaxID=113505 RepID=UPI00391F6697
MLHDKLAHELNGATYKAKTTFSPGGVARNIAEGLYKLNGSVSLISAFGDDQNGEVLRKTLPSEATESSQISSTFATASCAVILDKVRDCKIYVGDMDIHSEITPELIYANVDLIKHAPLICIDANLSHETIDAILLLACRYDKPVFYEPTDMLIAGKPFELSPQQYRQIKFMTPNIYELRKIVDTLKPSSESSTPFWAHDNDLKINKFSDEIAELCDKLHDDIDNIIVTAGSHGIFIKRFGTSNDKFFTNNLQYIQRGTNGDSKLRHYPATIENNVKSSSGAGDAFSAGFITAMLNQKSEAICVSVGFEAALASLRSVNTVPKEFFNKSHSCWNNGAKFNVF